MILRPYQQELAAKAEAALAEHKSVVVQLPTGGGKTVLFSHLVKREADSGGRVLVITHRRELVSQISAALSAFGVKHGLLTADSSVGKGNPLQGGGNALIGADSGFVAGFGERVQVAMQQTLHRRLEGMAGFLPTLIVIDECHHAVSRTWAEIPAAFPHARSLGLTATPVRADGMGLKALYSEMVCGPTIKELTEMGSLAPYELYEELILSADGVKKQMGDYNQKELAERADDVLVVGNAVTAYRRAFATHDNKQAIFFGASCAHSESQAEKFVEQGISAAHIDGETPDDERADSIARFKAGDITVLCNYCIIGEGFDAPAVGGVILARPTASLAVYLQQCGRALRPSGDKTAIILDLCENYKRHGLPDRLRKWSLNGVTHLPERDKVERPVGMGEGYGQMKKVVVEERQVQQVDKAAAAKFGGWVDTRKKAIAETFQEGGDYLREAAKQFATARKTNGEPYKNGWLYYALKEATGVNPTPADTRRVLAEVEKIRREVQSAGEPTKRDEIEDL